MSDSTDDLIVISPVTIKREFFTASNNGESSITSESSLIEYFPLEESGVRDTAVNNPTEVNNDMTDIPRDDPLGDISRSTVVLPVDNPGEIVYNGREYADEIDEIEGIINESEESISQMKGVFAVNSEGSHHVNEVTGIINIEAKNIPRNEPSIAKVKPANRLLANDYRKKNPILKKIKTAICLKCNTGFPSADLYEHHMSTVHQDERPYPCQFCEKRFQNATNCRRHETIHDPKRFKGPPQFACSFCDKRYHLQVSVRTHERIAHFGYKPKVRSSTAPVIQHHSRGTPNPNPYQKPKETFPCPHCDMTYSMRSLLRKHMFCHTKEKNFSCPICQQPFSFQTAMKKHIRTVHEQDTPTGLPHPAPRWKANQSYPCTLCTKTFKGESQLRRHMRAHSEERPIQCKFCPETYKRPSDLNQHVVRKHRPDIPSNPLKLFKCLICGRDNFTLFGTLRQHRIIHHSHIPYDSEREKPFVCGVCGKPHFLRERAIICTLLAHDPISLRNEMFRHQCPECPPETFGYRNLALLRSHWEEAHGEIPIPPKFRAGMYNDAEPDMTLPSCTIDRKKAEDIRNNGPPAELLNGEIQLFIERDLLPIPKEERFKPKVRRSKAKGRQGIQGKASIKHVNCEICGLCIIKRNLKRHIERLHSRKKRRGRPRNHPHPAGIVTSEMGIQEDFVVIKEEPLEVDEQEEDATSQEMPTSSMFSCRFCNRKFATVSVLRVHEKNHWTAKTILAYYNCSKCNLRFKKMKTLRAHEKIHQNPSSEKRRPGRPRKNPAVITLPEMDMVGNFVTVKKEFIDLDENEDAADEKVLHNLLPGKRRPGRPRKNAVMKVDDKEEKSVVIIKEEPIDIPEQEEDVAVIPGSTLLSSTVCMVSENYNEEFSMGTVNVNDVKAIRNLLGNKCSRVNLSRLEGVNSKTTTEKDPTFLVNEATSPSALSPPTLTSGLNVSLPRNNENINISGDRWKEILGNKLLQVVLRRVDS